MAAGSWMFGFLVGTLLGFFTSWFVTIPIICCGLVGSLAIVVYKDALQPLIQIVAFLAGFCWGAGNNAPQPPRSLPEVWVERGPIFPADNGGLLVRDSTGTVYSAQGAAHLASVGAVTVKASSVFLTPQRSYFRPLGLYRDDKTGFWPRILYALKRPLLRLTRGLPLHIRHWFACLVLGDMRHVPPETIEAFKRLGIIHAVVVSGMHVSFLIVIIDMMLLVPCIFLYASKLLSPGLWVRLLNPIKLVGAGIVLIYSLLVGLPQPTQRSALMYLCLLLARLYFLRRLSWQEKFLYCGCAQGALFPIGFLSLSNFLSWSAYLMVYPAAVQPRQPWVYALMTQTTLTFLVGGAIGQLSLIGILVNLALVPIFPLIFASCLLLFFHGLIPAPVGVFLIDFQESFLNIVRCISELCEEMPYLSLDLTVGQNRAMRVACLTVGLVMILNKCKELSKSK